MSSSGVPGHTRCGKLGIEGPLPCVDPCAAPAKPGVACYDRFGLAWLVAWSLLLNSLPAHKEFRFLLPALQLLIPYAGAAIAQLLQALRESMHDRDTGRTAPSATAANNALLGEDAVNGGGSADTLHGRGHRATSAHGDNHIAGGKVVCSMPKQQPNAWSVLLPSPVRRRAARSSGAAASQGAMAQADYVPRRQPGRMEQRGRRRRLMLALAGVVLCLSAQLTAAAYFCLVHQRCAHISARSLACTYVLLRTANLPYIASPACIHGAPCHQIRAILPVHMAYGLPAAAEGRWTSSSIWRRRFRRRRGAPQPCPCFSSRRATPRRCTRTFTRGWRPASSIALRRAGPPRSCV